jgi:hypothetical protein
MAMDAFIMKAKIGWPTRGYLNSTMAQYLQDLNPITLAKIVTVCVRTIFVYFPIKRTPFAARQILQQFVQERLIVLLDTNFLGSVVR